MFIHSQRGNFGIRASYPGSVSSDSAHHHLRLAAHLLLAAISSTGTGADPAGCGLPAGADQRRFIRRLG